MLFPLFLGSKKIIELKVLLTTACSHFGGTAGGTASSLARAGLVGTAAAF